MCLEKVVTNTEQSGITMTACQVNGQIGVADWLASGPYHECRLEGYNCVLGNTRLGTTLDASSLRSIAGPIMLSKHYLETARTLLRVARSMADQAIADRLKALAGDYERRAEHASDSESNSASASQTDIAKVRREMIP